MTDSIDFGVSASARLARELFIFLVEFKVLVSDVRLSSNHTIETWSDRFGAW